MLIVVSIVHPRAKSGMQVKPDLRPSDYIILPSKNVHQFAFSFVAPLRAKDNNNLLRQSL